jgi:hypothetical protein
MKQKNWVIGIVLSASALLAGLQYLNTPITSTYTSTSTLAYEGCAFIWAYYEEPVLTNKLNETIKELNINASATATLFGEDCIYADGTKTFSVKETNISIDLLVNDLSKREELGSWIKDVMQFVTKIPREEIQGNYGNVEFWFRKNEGEKLFVRVPIQNFLDESKDKTGIELFNLYYQQP